MSKLRTFEMLGFRPKDEAQDKLIRDAQKAAGINMAELLRRATLKGLPLVVAEAKATNDAAFNQFEDTLRETATPYTTAPPAEKPSRKQLKKIA